MSPGMGRAHLDGESAIQAEDTAAKTERWRGTDSSL